MEGNSYLNKLINLSQEKQIPFVVYSLPGSTKLNFVAETKKNTETIERELNNRFVFAPFHQKFKTEIVLRSDVFGEVIKDGERLLNEITRLKLNDGLDQNDEDQSPDKFTIIDKKSYLSQVEKIVEKIREGSFSKVVLSRLKMIEKPDNFSLGGVLKDLRNSYPEAFVYLFSHPLSGTWCGASPEMLLSVKNNNLKTVALAGTKSIEKEDIPWGEKELIEQKMVTTFIEEGLKSQKLPVLSKKGPITVRSGNLLHLKTMLEAKLLNQNNLAHVINQLHPTPAVCGLPKEQALDFIVNFEEHNRDYYAGFLGPATNGNSTSLFVNLRCFRILKDKLVIYVGGGITKDSIPEDEWEETELKTQTILNVLEHQTKLCEN